VLPGDHSGDRQGLTDRKIGRLRWPGKGRYGNRLIVRDEATQLVLLDHNAAETYRSNDEVESWLASWKSLHGLSD